MNLSKRLETIAKMVTRENVVADIGTDHGLVPIYLVKNKIAPRALAFDLRKAPLQRAREHIEKYNLVGQIETRLSNGLEKLKEGEAGTVIISGMGGNLITEILEKRKDLRASVKEFILSPQSDWYDFRKYLYENDFFIEDEEMLIDEGKYYVIIKAFYKETKTFVSEKDLYFGKMLLAKKSKVLKQYLEKELNKYNEIYEKLSIKENTFEIEKRKNEVKSYISIVEEALDEL